MFFLCLFLVIHYRKEREKVKLGAILGIASIVPIFIVLVLATMKWKKVAFFLGSVACIMSFSITNHKLKPYNREAPWPEIGKIDPLDRWFRISDLNIGRINQQLYKIPSDASVAATENVVSHFEIISITFLKNLKTLITS